MGGIASPASPGAMAGPTPRQLPPLCPLARRWDYPAPHLNLLADAGRHGGAAGSRARLADQISLTAAAEPRASPAPLRGSGRSPLLPRFHF